MEKLDDVFRLDKALSAEDFSLKFLKTEEDVKVGASSIFWKEVEGTIRIRIATIARRITDIELDDKQTTLLRGALKELFWVLSIPDSLLTTLKQEYQDAEKERGRS